jgi:YVTN family beta-propeller protein
LGWTYSFSLTQTALGIALASSAVPSYLYFKVDRLNQPSVPAPLKEVTVKPRKKQSLVRRPDGRLLIVLSVLLSMEMVEVQTRAYVPNGGDNTVSVIDTVNNTVVANVSVGAVPVRVAITPDGARTMVAPSP